MFHYDKLFEPYTADGATLENTILWLKKSIDIDERIVSEVVNDTMHLLASGEKFTLPCPCGCGVSNVHTPINHFMLAKAFDLKTKAEKAFSEVIKKNEVNRLEARQQLLSDFDKQYEIMLHGTKLKQVTDKHVPTFKRLLGFK